MSSALLGYSESQTVTTQFFTPTMYFCPNVMFANQYAYDILEGHFLITPNVYLDCTSAVGSMDVTSHTISNMKWTVDGFN